MARNFDELKRELLDHRGKLVDWWLTATAIFLTLLSVLMAFFVIVLAIVGYIGFQKISEIEKEARQYMEMTKGHEETAGEGAKRTEEHKEEAERNLKQIGYMVEDISDIESPTAKPSPEDVPTEITQSDSDKTSQAAEIAGETDTQLQARAWFSVGYLYGEEESWEASIDAYGKVLELEPDNADAYNNRGVARNELGEHVAALMDYDEAIRLAPDDTSAYNNRGNAKSDLGQNEAALADYGKALELDHNNASAYHNRGNAKFDLGQHDEALADYDKAIHLNPALVEAYNNRGIVKNKLGQHDEALADLNEAIRLKHDYVGAYNNRGVTNKDLGRLNEAREDYQKALALAQESGNEDLIAMVKRNLSRLDNDQAP